MPISQGNPLIRIFDRKRKKLFEASNIDELTIDISASSSRSVATGPVSPANDNLPASPPCTLPRPCVSGAVDQDGIEGTESILELIGKLNEGKEKALDSRQARHRKRQEEKGIRQLNIQAPKDPAVREAIKDFTDTIRSEHLEADDIHFVNRLISGHGLLSFLYRLMRGLWLRFSPRRG